MFAVFSLMTTTLHTPASVMVSNTTLFWRFFFFLFYSIWIFLTQKERKDRNAMCTGGYKFNCILFFWD